MWVSLHRLPHSAVFSSDDDFLQFCFSSAVGNESIEEFTQHNVPGRNAGTHVLLPHQSVRSNFESFLQRHGPSGRNSAVGHDRCHSNLLAIVRYNRCHRSRQLLLHRANHNCRHHILLLARLLFGIVTEHQTDRSDEWVDTGVDLMNTEKWPQISSFFSSFANLFTFGCLIEWLDYNSSVRRTTDSYQRIR